MSPFGIPFIPFIIVIAAFFDPSIWNVVIAMAILLWRDTGRVIRSQVLVIKEQAFVSAARVSGASNLRIIFVYIAPSILPLSFLYGSFAIAWAILTEASVSFLGFSDPETISWGFMLQDAFLSLGFDARRFLLDHPARPLHHADGHGRLLHRPRLRRSALSRV